MYCLVIACMEPYLSVFAVSVNVIVATVINYWGVIDLLMFVCWEYIVYIGSDRCFGHC